MVLNILRIKITIFGDFIYAFLDVIFIVIQTSINNLEIINPQLSERLTRAKSKQNHCIFCSGFSIPIKEFL